VAARIGKPSLTIIPFFAQYPNISTFDKCHDHIGGIVYYFWKAWKLGVF